MNDQAARDAKPRILTIDASVPFADALAEGLLARAGADPMHLARFLVLLPTRRACRTVREAFLRATDGKALLLPRLQPIGDVDEEELTLHDASFAAIGDVPPSIDPLRRQMLLARQILALGDLSAEQAALRAASLAQLLDHMQTERVDFAALNDLAPDTLAEHWQTTLRFLSIVTRYWPKILKAENAIDPAARRNLLLTRQAERWRADPPDFPIVAAGSTGSIPATADLLAVIAHLPRGEIVLPGLDRGLDEAAWAALDETHPQFGLQRLLRRLGVERQDVAPWSEPEAAPRAGAGRAVAINCALWPAQATGEWRAQEFRRADIEAGFAPAQFRYIECAHPREEAASIAAVLRHALEDDGKTACLVTPDRELARRVAAELRRWDVDIDDSAGIPLEATPPGAFLRLIADAAGESWSPVKLLALLKHPLTTLGWSPGECRARARLLDRHVLRGPRPAPGLSGLRARLRQAKADGDIAPEPSAAIAELLDRIEKSVSPLEAVMGGRAADIGALLRAHVETAEAFARGEADEGARRLWAGDDGEAAGQFLADMADAARDFPKLPTDQYADLLRGFIQGRVVRPRFGRHPRLAILGLLEARLAHFDLMVLGGLNETSWPPSPAVDPFLSRPMREKIGLSSPDRRIGLTAHDFAQAFAAPRIVLTRARRSGNAPTVPSRFLVRLETFLKAIGMLPDGDARSASIAWRDDMYRAYVDALGAPERFVRIARPSFAPPGAARPRRISVTEVETLRRDQYAYYAKHILKLPSLDGLDADFDAAQRGTIIHHALAQFVKQFPSGALPANARAALLRAGRAAFGARLDEPSVRIFWWPRFERIATWFVAEETLRRARLAYSHTECDGKTKIEIAGETFELRARADRIDVGADGALAIIDYKTGAVPKKSDIEAGYSPQLTLEAAIARSGGFAPIPKGARIASLEYWRLTGGAEAAKIHPIGKSAEDTETAITSDAERLRALFAYFADPAHAYVARPRSQYALRYNDYAHLERIAEWSSVADEDEA